jgi:putative transposase
MSRKKLERSDVYPYHVTVRTNNREQFLLPLEKVWEIVGHECLFLSLIYGTEFQAVVLMPNHIHMILTVPQFDLGIVMNEFLKSISRTLNRLTGRTGHLFGSAHHRSIIKNSRYFGIVIKYVYRNPVKAGLCGKVEQYPFSTLHGLLGEAHLPFPISYSRMALESSLPAFEALHQLVWLNQPFPKEAEVLIRKALRRTVIESILSETTRRESELVNACAQQKGTDYFIK